MTEHEPTAIDYEDLAFAFEEATKYHTPGRQTALRRLAQLARAEAQRIRDGQHDAESTEISRIEVEFAVPVLLTMAHARTLHDIVEATARACTPDGCVHWLCGMGQKPNLSRADLTFLGKPDNPDAPESGEPTWDPSVLYLETCCQPALRRGRFGGAQT